MDRSAHTPRDQHVVVLSDVHLSANLQPERERAVCQALARHPGLDVVFLGDLFEFSSSRAVDPGVALGDMARANPALVAAIRQHTQTGARVFMVCGNHDAELANIGPHVTEVFGRNTRVVPWCLQLGSVHLEHGHSFDRDNAPLHPLATHARAHESLGAALMRSVVVELDVRALAHAHDLTPSRALVAGVRTLGWRLPGVLLRLVGVLGFLTLAAAWGRWGARAAHRREGAKKLGPAASDSGVSEQALRALSEASPTPTHASFWRMAWRLYLDLPCAVLVAGFCAAFWCLGLTHAVWGVVASVAYMLTLVLGHLVGLDMRRYEPPLQALSRGSNMVARLTGASRVVFGHTHVEYDDGLYFNLGSFGYGGSAGRPYALVAPNGSVTRHFVAHEDGQ